MGRGRGNASPGDGDFGRATLGRHATAFHYRARLLPSATGRVAAGGAVHIQPHAPAAGVVVGTHIRQLRLRVAGDRTDIQLAALETSTTCLILTGNLRPSPLIVKQADEFGVPVLLVRPNTMETIEQIEMVFGKTRLGQPSKLDNFHALMTEHLDIERLYSAMGLG